MPESETDIATYSSPHALSPPVSASSSQLAEELELAGKRMSWEYDIWGSRPRWVVEPCIRRIKEVITPHVLQQSPGNGNSNLTPAQDITLEFLAQGAFNKVYTATLRTSGQDQSYIVRLSLPVEPHHKTASEVATIQYLRSKTSIPIPEIFAWDSDEGNPIGFEWILMKKVTGLPLREVWYPEGRTGTVDWDIKQRVVEELVGAVAELWRLRFPVAGSLYLTDSCIDILGRMGNASCDHISVRVGKIVARDFFWENHLDLADIERGPFHSSGPWLQSQLRFVIADAERILQMTQTQRMQGVPDEDELEQAEFMKETAERLLRQLPVFFHENTPPESFTLLHPDLSAQNILVDSSGILVGIIDWECTHALPTWSACQIPHVLQFGNPRTEKPLPENYMVDEEPGGPNGLYFEHLQIYETTLLQQLFLDRMKEIEPSWIEEFESVDGNRMRDFETAVCWAGDTSGLYKRKLRKWLDMLEGQKGKDATEYYSLLDRD